MHLDAKLNLKFQESEVTISLVNMNVDVKKGVQNIFTKIVEG